MNNVAFMNVVNAETQVDKDFPDEVVSEELSFLALNRVEKITTLAVLHHDANRLLCHK